MYLFWFESYGQDLSFSKVGQTSRSRSQGQNLWYHVKGLVIRNTDMKYKSFIFKAMQKKFSGSQIIDLKNMDR